MECLGGTKSHHLSHHPSGFSQTEFTDNIMRVHISSTGNPGLSIIHLHKAVFTLDLHTASILVVNNVAVKLLGYSPEEFARMSLLDLLHDDMCVPQGKVDQLAGGVAAATPTEIPFKYNGQVVELVRNGGDVIPVSLWIKQLEVADRILAVVEPVERHDARILLDGVGLIMGMDVGAEAVFQCKSDRMLGEPLSTLIPGLGLKIISDDIATGIPKKQTLCGRIPVSQHAFPLTLTISRSRTGSSTYSANIHVFPSVSGLLVINKFGIVQSCNHHVTQAMFGLTQAELLGQPITTLLPDFCQSLRTSSTTITLSDLGRSDGMPSQTSLYYSALDAQTGSSTSQPATPTTSTTMDLPTTSNPTTCSQPTTPQAGPSELVPITRPPTSLHVREPCACSSDEDTPTASPHNELYETAESSVEMYESSSDEDRDDVVYTCSAPTSSEPNNKLYWETSKESRRKIVIRQGFFTGFGVHKDTVLFDVNYWVRKRVLLEEESIYLVWVQVADTSLTAESETHSSAVFQRSSGNTLRSRNHSNSPGQLSRVLDSDLCQGSYGVWYTNLQQIGNGAFGVVKVARYKPDERLVVTKFITKHKIIPSLIVDDTCYGRVPLEISILRILDHPNIVKVLDVYENNDYHILVMEKQTNGMDLFDFINRMVADEPLNSYIFRQIVSALGYLHSKSIIHRDIKDENIIIDYNFDTKLIDFGSATFMKEGGLFSTFSGTVQYCSPEVLEGNHYAGPELDVWALGVTLYTMVFHDSPFGDIEDTIRGVLRPFPHPATPQLVHIIQRMLSRDVQLRATIQDIAADPWTQQSVDINRYSFEDMLARVSGSSATSDSHRWARHHAASDISSSSSSGSSNSSTTVDNFDSEEEEAHVIEPSDDSCSSLESIERQDQH